MDGEDYNTPTDNINYLLDKIIEVIPAPQQLEGAPQMLITSLDYSNYTGRIAVGKVTRGSLKSGQMVTLAKRDGVTDVQSTFLEASLDVREQIEDISEEWAQLKARPEMKFTLGGVEELRDPRVRLLYAIDADGRVLGVTAVADSLFDAVTAAYGAADQIGFEGLHRRSDIGQKALAAL